jgi:EpsI family protein
LDGPALWAPKHQATEFTIAARYADGSGEAQLFVVLFPRQRQGGEAINQDNEISTELVRLNKLGTRSVSLGSEQVSVSQGKAILPVNGVRTEHLVWQWYRVAGRSLSNRYEGKAWEALARIYPGRADGAWIAVTTPIDKQGLQAAESRLAEFARAITPHVDLAIDAVLGLGD